VFGMFGYWHQIEGATRGARKEFADVWWELFEGSIEQRAAALLALWRADKIKQLAPNNPGAAADIARAMALELGVASTRLDSGIPAAVVELVREILPKWAYVMIDPLAVYSGEHAGKGAPDPLARLALKAFCRDTDCAHAMRTGETKSAKALADDVIAEVRKRSDFRHLGDGWSDAPNVERTVTRWREGYASDLDEAISYHLRLERRRRRRRVT
jgi:hypothetical protein